MMRRVIILVALARHATSDGGTPPATVRRPGLPPWLSHVDAAFLREKRDLASARHAAAIRTALENFDTDGAADGAAGRDGFDASALSFDEYRIAAEGYRLPDFHDELGRAPVFVTSRATPLFSPEECGRVVREAEEYYAGVAADGTRRAWPTLPSGQYYIQGFWIKDGPPAIKAWFVRMVRTRLFAVLDRQFPDFCEGVEKLVVDNAYMFKYSAAPGLRTEIHTDAGCLSFTFALNSNAEYEGGGTFVEGLTRAGADDGAGSARDGDNILEMDVGQCTVRPGGIRHGGNPLESGVRYIVGGFCMHKEKVETVRMLLDNPPAAAGATEREALEAAVALEPRCDLPYATLAHLYERDGDAGKARAVVEECLAVANPRSASAAYYLGTMSYRAGDYEKAVACMETCLGVDPKDGDAMQTLYQSFAQLGRQEDEARVLVRLVATPGVSRRVLANAHCNLGTLCADGDAELGHYSAALDCDPTSASTWHSLGSALASQQSWQKAVAAYQRTLELLDGGGDSAEEAPGQRRETLGCLYRAAAQQLRGDLAARAASAPPAKEAMLDMLVQIMGADNYKGLVALSSQ